MKKGSLVILTALMFLVLFAGEPIAGEAPIRIGAILPLTGEQAEFGAIEKNSFIMGLEEINRAGGIKGRPIELLFEDDCGKPDNGRLAVEKLVTQDGVVALTGGYSSAVTYVMCAVAQQLKTPFLVTTGSADKITEQGWDYVFRINPPVSEYSKALNSFLSEIVRPNSVAILHENTLFGQSGAKEFADQCEKAGIKILVKEGYESGSTDFKPLLIKVKSARPDFVYMVSYVMDAALLMRQSMELNFNAKLFVGAGAGFTIPDFARQAGVAAEYVFSADLWTPNLPYPGAMEYYNNYQKRFGSVTGYHGAEAYGSIYVIADALRRTRGDITPDAIREALTSTDLMTAFGPVRFVSYGKKKQQNALPTFLVQWQKGAMETVWPKNVSTKPYAYPVPEWGSR